MSRAVTFLVGILLFAISAASALLFYREQQRNLALTAALSDVVAAKERCSTDLAAVSAKAVDLQAKVDQLQNSDRIAFEQLISGGTDDLAAAHDALDGFLRQFPNSQYRPAAAAELQRVDALLAAAEKDVQAALAAAKAAPDALAAYKLLEAADGAMADSRIIEAMDARRAEAETIRAQREAFDSLGIALEEVSAEWELRGELWVPRVKLNVRNKRNGSIGYLKLVAQFIDTKTETMMGDETSDYIASSMGIPLSAGMAKTSFLYGSVGFKSDWALVTDGGPKVKAKLFAVGSSGQSPVPIKELSVKLPPQYRPLN